MQYIKKQHGKNNNMAVRTGKLLKVSKVYIQQWQRIMAVRRGKLLKSRRYIYNSDRELWPSGEESCWSLEGIYTTV